MATSTKPAYDPSFYEAQGPRSRDSASVILPIVNDLVHPASVLDVGCGVGAWLETWQRLGVTDLIGIDGSYVERERLLIDPSRFVAADLEKPFRLGRRFDLAECLEVAEHIDEFAADILVRSLAEHSDTVLFGAAIPAQGGTHHVNEQWPSYWIPKFATLGFQAFDPIRPLIWTNPNVQFWYRQNSLLFSRTLSFGTPGQVLDLVHPDLWSLSQQPDIRFVLRAFPDAIRTVIRNRILRIWPG